MVVELPALPIVFLTAIVDSINPCAIGVLILLATTLLAFSKKNKHKMLAIGLTYIAVVYITYFLAGLGLLYFIQKLQIGEVLGVIVGCIVILLGLLEIKDFFWYGKGISLAIPAKRAEQIKKYMEKVSYPMAIFLGFFVAAVELPCTGGPYLAITTLLAQIGFNAKVVGYLLLYNFIFVLPLILILLLIYFGMSAQKVKDWKEGNKKWMRLAIGLVMIALGVLLIFFATGIINFTIVV